MTTVCHIWKQIASTQSTLLTRYSVQFSKVQNLCTIYSSRHHQRNQYRHGLHTSGVITQDQSCSGLSNDESSASDAEDFSKMTVEDHEIHRIHTEACKAGKDTYIDPATGYTVITRLAHLRRGKCCGSACRHCPYNHEAVPEERRKK